MLALREPVMSMDYIRRAYKVPAKRGMTVTIVGDGARIQARIVGSRGQYLRLWIPGGKRSHLYHPTDALEYPAAACSKTPNFGVEAQPRKD
jgi:hypothetical protein